MEFDGIGTDKAPLPLHERQPIRSFLYNPETQEYCGGKLKVLIVLLLLLLLVGAGVLAWPLIMDSSAPALNFEPRLENAVDSRLIWLKRSDLNHSNRYGDRLTQFFQQEYIHNGEWSPFSSSNCAYGGDAAGYETACLLDVASLNRGCSKENSNYGYDHEEGTPCVLIRLDKIEGWTPQPYKTREDLKLAKERGMPSDLLKMIQGFLNESNTHPWLGTIWMGCEGEGPADRENIGPLKYFSPAFRNSEFQGVPAYYFPYMNQKGYKAPFIFIKFVKPQYNVAIRVTCRAWAKNITPEDPLGKVEFDLMID